MSHEQQLNVWDKINQYYKKSFTFVATIQYGNHPNVSYSNNLSRKWVFSFIIIFFNNMHTFFFFFEREFQPMIFALDDSSLSLNQDTNQFLV